KVGLRYGTLQTWTSRHRPPLVLLVCESSPRHPADRDDASHLPARPLDPEPPALQRGSSLDARPPGTRAKPPSPPSKAPIVDVLDAYATREPRERVWPRTDQAPPIERPETDPPISETLRARREPQ